MKFEMQGFIAPEVEQVRQKLDNMILEYGLDHLLVLEMSQHLDELIIKAMNGRNKLE